VKVVSFALSGAETMKGLFETIESDKAAFADLINQAVSIVPREVTNFFKVENRVAPEKVQLARDHYLNELQHYSLYLQSKNPDHYKRSGALLHALCINPVIERIDGEHTAESLSDPIGHRFTSDEAEYLERYMKFHEEYCNQLVAFEISCHVCNLYEPTPKVVTFDVIRNVCHYLKHNKLPRDAYFMLFKTLMA
jgi:hypothetical protein